MLEEVRKNLPKYCHERLLEGISSLTPPQEEAVRKGIFSEKNFIIVSPTASGKTLIAEMAFCYEIVNNGKKAVYVVPLRSIAFEKYEEFRKKYEGLFKVAISVGDYDSSDPWLREYDLIIVTAEKLDSLIRHKADWLREVGLLVVDEIHLIGSKSRGATLEILITKMKLLSNPRIIALSATIENWEELSNWLGGEVVLSNWRPVKLLHKIYFKSLLINDSKYELDSDYRDPYRAICEDTLKKGKQIIFFINSRKRAEALAKKLSSITKKYLSEAEKLSLKNLSDRIKNVLEIPTEQCLKLGEVVLDGVAFHHAGLLNEQRILIEKHFREGLIKVICATPTLAMGVNLPAFRVFIEKERRGGWISPIEYHQMAGRAGRPGFEEYGEAITLAKYEEEIEKIREYYHSGRLNEVKSSLFSEGILRTHLLSLISDGFIRDGKSMEHFFRNTFFYYQRRDLGRILEVCQSIISKFIEWNFVEEESGYYFPTKLGKRVSELYIDPLTAKRLIDFMKRDVKRDEIFFLYSVASSEEMKPLPEFGIKEFPVLKDFYERYKDSFPEEEPEAWEWSDFYSRVKMVAILKNWIDEVPEKVILERFGISPGDLRSYVSISEWIAYSMEEIGKIIGFEDVDKVNLIRRRLRHGVREELLDLVKIKYIGRVRARILYNYGIKNEKDILEAGIEKIKSILGKKTGEKVYYYVKGEVKKVSENLLDYLST